MGKNNKKWKIKKKKKQIEKGTAKRFSKNEISCDERVNHFSHAALASMCFCIYFFVVDAFFEFFKDSMGDDEVNVSKKRQRRRQLSSSDESEGEDGGDELLVEVGSFNCSLFKLNFLQLDVRMANLLPNTEAFTMQFPARKKNVFDNSHPPQARFKKNVKFVSFTVFS